MCLNPLIIRNKGYHVDFDGFPSTGGMPYVECPCRNCAECADTLQIDYFVRAWAMYRYLPANWSVWFCTLTFNEDNVPWSDVGEYVAENEYKTIDRVRCFDHRLLHRFTKNFIQYFRRKGLEKPHLLITCEFGEKFGRPHYHMVAFVPCQYSSFSEFKKLVETYWHYGFTKDISLARVDYQSHTRTVENCFKYVTKYVCKFNSPQPYYFNHEQLILKDLKPCYYTPRVFTTNGFGKALENILTEINYQTNKVTFCVLGKYRQFNLPSYFRRRHYTKTNVVCKKKVVVNTPWEKDKVCNRYVTYTSYINGYEKIREDMLRKRFRIAYDQFAYLAGNLTRDDYVNYKMLDYNKHNERRWTYRDVQWNLHKMDVINDDSVKWEHIFCGVPLVKDKKVVTLWHDSTSTKYEEVSVSCNLFCRHVDYLQYLVRKYGDRVLSWLYLLESKYFAFRRFEISRRKRKKEGERVTSEQFYKDHHCERNAC